MNLAFSLLRGFKFIFVAFWILKFPWREFIFKDLIGDFIGILLLFLLRITILLIISDIGNIELVNFILPFWMLS